MKDPQPITMKNGKPATVGTCPYCGTKIYKIGAATILLDQGHLVSAFDEVARQVVADRAPANDDDVHTASAALHQNSFDVLGAFNGGADGVDSKLLVGLRALGVVDARDDMRNFEDVLGDL